MNSTKIESEEVLQLLIENGANLDWISHTASPEYDTDPDQSDPDSDTEVDVAAYHYGYLEVRQTALHMAVISTYDILRFKFLFYFTCCVLRVCI